MIRAPRALGGTLVAGGVAGIFTSAALIVEKIHLLQDPDAALSCDLNAFVGCGGVVSTAQASVFGFPNPLLGVVGFTVVLMIGVLVLSGVAMPGWMWAGLQVGVIGGAVFVTWLQFESIYRLERLCPYCMVVWVLMIPIAVGVTTVSLRSWRPGSRASRTLDDWAPLVASLWLVALASSIWFQFGTRLWA